MSNATLIKAGYHDKYNVIPIAINQTLQPDSLAEFHALAIHTIRHAPRLSLRRSGKCWTVTLDDQYPAIVDGHLIYQPTLTDETGKQCPPGLLATIAAKIVVKLHN